MSVYDELVARLERAESRIDDLEGEIRFLRGLISNPYLSSSQKLTLWVVRDLILRTRSSADQLTEIDVKELGKLIGASRFTAGKQLIELAKMGALARRERTELEAGRNGGKKYRTHIQVALTLFAERPDQLRPLEARNHGGKREPKRCPHCGSEDLVQEQRVFCACCKRELDYHLEPVNEGMSIDEIVDRSIEREKRGKKQ
jgi:hypothetical protein